MNRREFIGWCGVGAIASSLPIAIAACSPDAPEATSEAISGANSLQTPGTPQADGFQAVGTLSQLQEEGKILEKQSLPDPLLVVLPAGGQSPVAVNPTCTHQGCLVDWQADQKKFVCPCHGSQYGPEGKVTQGPASEPLATFPIKVEAEQVLVKVT